MAVVCFGYLGKGVSGGSFVLACQEGRKGVNLAFLPCSWVITLKPD